MPRKAAIAAVALVAAAAAAWLANVTGIGRRPIVWELPAGYHGWVVFTWNDSRCPTLRSVGAEIPIPIPASGRACTSASDTIPERFRRHEFVYVDGSGRREPLPDELGGGPAGRTIRTMTQQGNSTVFFVGTTAELEATPRPP